MVSRFNIMDHVKNCDQVTLIPNSDSIVPGILKTVSYGQLEQEGRLTFCFPISDVEDKAFLCGLEEDNRIVFLLYLLSEVKNKRYSVKMEISDWNSTISRSYLGRTASVYESKEAALLDGNALEIPVGILKKMNSPRGIKISFTLDVPTAQECQIVEKVSSQEKGAVKVK